MHSIMHTIYKQVDVLFFKKSLAFTERREMITSQLKVELQIGKLNFCVSVSRLSHL